MMGQCFVLIKPDTEGVSGGGAGWFQPISVTSQVPLLSPTQASHIHQQATHCT